MPASVNQSPAAPPRPPKQPPPCAPDSPAWLLAVRDEYAATGRFNLKAALDNLRVGERVINSWEEVVKEDAETIRLVDRFPRDDGRTWRVISLP